MCLEKIKTYSTCKKQVTSTMICYKHIELTHKQIGDPSCPYSRTVYKQSDSTTCGCKFSEGEVCKRKDKKDTWKFETESEMKEREARLSTVLENAEQEMMASIKKFQAVVDGLKNESPSGVTPNTKFEFVMKDSHGYGNSDDGVKMKLEEDLDLDSSDAHQIKRRKLKTNEEANVKEDT